MAGVANKRLLIAVAVFGIALEIVAIILLATRTITVPIAVPILIAGMFLGMVPAFALSRTGRR